MSKYDCGRELIARAVVIKDECLLVNEGKNKRTGQSYFALPGGHVDPGESCAQAVAREFEEELEAAIAVGDLLFVGEQVYAGRGKDDGTRHELTLLFAATLTKAPREENGTILSPEKSKNFRWLPLSELAGANLLPRALKQYLLEQDSGPRYAFHDDTR